jgi:hypothetical protein
MTKENLSAEKTEPSNEQESSGKRLKDSVVTFFLFLVGELLLFLALFWAVGFLSSFFSSKNFARWNVFGAVAFVATILFVVGWIRIFRGFLAQSLDEFGQAVAARYMRMTSFLAVSLWVLAYITSDAVWLNFVTAFLKFVRFGQFNAGTLFYFVALALLASATVYFIVRWVMLRFFKRW